MEYHYQSLEEHMHAPDEELGLQDECWWIYCLSSWLHGGTDKIRDTRDLKCVFRSCSWNLPEIDWKAESEPEVELSGSKNKEKLHKNEKQNSN